MENSDALPGEFAGMIADGEDVSTVVCDYIAGMTDNYAVEVFQKLFIPSSWNKM